MIPAYYPCRVCSRLRTSAGGVEALGGALVWASSDRAEWICDDCLEDAKIIEPSRIQPASLIQSVKQ